MKDTKNVIGDRISALLLEKNKKQKDLAEFLNVTANTISYYVTGARIPNIDQLKKIAVFFDVSIDYLLGASNVASMDIKIQEICDYIGLNDKAIKRLHNIKTSTRYKEGNDYLLNEFNALDVIQAFILSESLSTISRQVKILQELNEKYYKNSEVLNFVNEEKANEYFEKKDEIEEKLFKLCGNRVEIISLKDKIDLKLCQLEKILLSAFAEISKCKHLEEDTFDAPLIGLADIAYKVDGNMAYNVEEFFRHVFCGLWEESGDEFVNKYTINQKGAETHGDNPKEK